ncbi:MAG: molecular chaperone TorD family protein [Haloarculaceae archaeon]
MRSQQPRSEPETSGRDDERPTDGCGGEPDRAAEVDARVYRVIGGQFLERPDRERVDAVGIWAREWRCTAQTLPHEFEAALDRIVEATEVDQETLRSAYTHLFRGISERAPDPPYESLYADGQFYSDTTTEIRQGYRWAGVDVDEARGNEPPDHLGLELQFLGELVATEGLDRGPDEPGLDDAMWWILDEHLMAWLPSYRATIVREDPPAYYAGLLDLALAVVTTHHDSLAEKR